MSAGRHLLPLALLALQASLCHGACVEVDSDTEAVANEGFKLGCISCKMRGEVPATASVKWYFKASDETEFSEVRGQMMQESFENVALCKETVSCVEK
ncbi:sodium channel subunit beta-3 [Stegastes partitus]|uniref:Sodium channel subunit beta-3 n=1 Tax=Stegastes partitus TaxID=144197 RepID=A0A9Y4K7V2_9TELE|nr:PREDICTED: sodium channel subunit beta-1 [Stegastes partitus]